MTPRPRPSPCHPLAGVVVEHRCCLGTDCADNGRDECDFCENAVSGEAP